ncbi:MAG: hypothetical protein ACLFRY_15560 [Spirochaetia bacterium]
MYPRRRTRRRPVKKYTIAHLLEQQPKSLRKNPDYKLMLSHLHSSPKLKNLRMTRRCYSLLLHGKITEENLVHFYRTYRLPKDPFFPLYFKIKREYLAKQRSRREEKLRFIAGEMRSLPEPYLGFVRYLARFEQGVNRAGKNPVWDEYIFPKTKKLARAYREYGREEWLSVVQGYLKAMRGRYRKVSDLTADRLLAWFILECAPEDPRNPPDRQAIIRSYRRLSKVHHPDRGGDEARFVALKWARDLLSSV